ncbi:FAD/NAD(P)-binding domain-containing protein, partial [Exidia glandulosa HHB12029]
MSTTFSPRIAIIGGGPAGLVLVNVLARNNIAATLYERDAEFSSRAHLGETGQAAMKGAGVWETFQKNSRPEGEETKMLDKDGNVVYHHVPPPDNTSPSRPEIDRSMLRKILLDAAPAGSVKFGHAFVSATPVTGTAQWELVFANGHKTVVDLVVGADGAHSRIRPLVSDVRIRYVGLTGVEVSMSPDVGAAHKELLARIGSGSAYALDGPKFLAAQINGDGRVRMYAWFHSDDPDVVPSDPAAAIPFILSHYEGWAPWMRQLIELADPQAVYRRPLYMLPVGHSWTHRAGVTLVGDAMNLMTPFAGQGANIAVWAALQLALKIIGVRESGGGLQEMDAAVAAYEQEAGKRAKEEAFVTEVNMNRVLNGEGAQGMAEALRLIEG